MLFIVVDSLDKYNKISRTLIKVLKALLKKTPQLKILLYSRPEEEIMRQFEQTTKISMESSFYRDNAIV